jgi:subtilase family serine protease
MIPVRSVIRFFLFCILFAGLSYLFFIQQPQITNAQSFSHKILRAITIRQFRSVCGSNTAGTARCLAHVVTGSNGNPLTTGSPLSSSYGPVQFHTAYNLPCAPGGSMQSICSTPSAFGGQTIALITAYNDQHIANDLSVYSSYYGLPQCTTANGCLTISNENGGSNLPVLTNSGWALETSLDVETAHMVCQTCKILLVEANSSNFTDLGAAVNTAVHLGATEISNSYGGSEWSSETSYDTSYYSHPGIAVTASAGDSGYGAEFPASSPNVVAVGGTTLQINTDNTYANESVWNGTGSGCSFYEAADVWQKNLSNWNLTNCGAKRAIADVAADADPDTGASVYDSTPYAGTSGWFQIGGTSLASPLIAGIYALAGGVPVNTNATSLPYAGFTTLTSHSITQGSNGACGTIMCNAGSGYNGPGGLGSPNGIAGFSQNPVLPSPTPTPTVIPTPTLIVTPTATPTPTQIPTQTANFGYQSVGNFIDTQDNNFIDGSRFEMGTTKGTLKSISVYIRSVQNSPNNQYQVAIYSDNNGLPGSLISKSASGTLTANSWNTLPVSAALNANTYYWLMYNTNSTNGTLNELSFTTTTSLNGIYSSGSIAFRTWPQTFNSRRDGYEYSLYATYTTP